MNEQHKKIQVNSDFYTKAQVHREALTDKELIEFCNYNLKRLGGMLAPNEHWQHLGSFATHIFKPQTVESFMFIHQNAMSGVAEVVASKAFEDLKGTLMETYSRKRQTKRSGF